jgi:streptogramin lyase
MRFGNLISFILLSVGMMSGGLLFSQSPTFPFPESSLNGVVTSKTGAPLEGVIVRAAKEKTPIAYNVVSDAQGKYRFPKLEAGRYAVEIARADGMDEPRQEGVEIKPGQEARVDFQIAPAQDMDQHITSVDWLRNLPGTPEQAKLISDECTHCHTGTLTRFRFDKDNWLKIIRLMRGTTLHSQAWGMPTREGRKGDARNIRDLPGFEEKNMMIAEYLAKVRGPEPLKWDPATTKVIPRPTGRSTRVMFTEYWIPYENAELHDIGVDKEGMVWWTDWRWPYVGRLNPNTGEMKYWESPPMDGKPEVHPGSQEVGFDEEGNLWTTLTWTGGLLKFDRKTEKFSTWMFPDRGYRKLMQNGMDHKRGRVWFSTHNMDDAEDNDIGFYMPETGQYTVYNDFALYGLVVDEEGNANALERGKGRSQIGRVDVATGKRTNYPTPTPRAFPRRGDHDSQGRIWFAEYNAGQVGVLDPKAGKITEYKMPLGPLSLPYGTGVDRVNDIVWVENYRADTLTAVDPKTGEVWDYRLPERHVMSRSPVGHPSSKPGYSVMWLGTLGRYTNGKLVKIEAWYQ